MVQERLFNRKNTAKQIAERNNIWNMPLYIHISAKKQKKGELKISLLKTFGFRG